jgi:Arc/MetJ-type ribon-helix-helix transcriptional regulator
MTRSDFIKVAVERALQQREKIARERKDAQGYSNHPQQSEEIEEWQDEQEGRMKQGDVYWYTFRSPDSN